MSNWLAGIIVAAIGALLGGIVTSCFALKAIRAAEKKLHDAYKDGHFFGFKAGYRRGKALQRVDVAPGNDEHTEFILCCPMPFKSAKIVRSDEEPRIISCDRVDKAPGPDSIRPEVKHAPSD